VKTSLKESTVGCYHFRKRNLAGSDRSGSSQLQKPLASIYKRF
jgi:hypothetical protein